MFGLEWDRVHLDGGYFWIDKTKNGDPLELPITNTLKAIFDRRYKLRVDNNKYVFPAERGGEITDPRKVIDKIKEKTSSGEYTGEKPINFTCHDARRTFATIAELSGVGTYILKRLMNHKSGRTSDVTQGYISLPVEELQEPAIRIETKILNEAGITIDCNIVENIFSSISLMNSEEKERLLEYID